MGLTRTSVGKHATKLGCIRSCRTVALAGNPNVGKSTLFNALTGLHQHTGNWPGKTVERAVGQLSTAKDTYELIDLPGCYSLHSGSPEEEIARNFLVKDRPALCAVVCDATALERGLVLALEIIELEVPVVLIVNLMDEAARKGISVDTGLLEKLMGVRVVATSAGRKRGLDAVRAAVDEVMEQQTYPLQIDRGCHAAAVSRPLIEGAAYIADRCVQHEREYRISPADRVLTNKWTAFPLMLLLLAGIFWLTIEGANYPSALLQKGLFWVEEWLYQGSLSIGLPLWLCEVLWHGVYRVTAWVVGVMLPPMAIFFPLFTLMEDVGLLPRIAFNLDRGFHRCHACGKQSLCMMMGLGCNAAGVVGCRIIETRRERLIAMLTNAFMPCNGRFPMLITLIALFALGGGIIGSLTAALWLAALIVLAVCATLICSWLLSKTVLGGTPSPLSLELPPYRRPNITQILWRSLCDRTLFVLGRAVKVAAPAGLIIWLLANIFVGEQSLLLHAASALDPVAQAFGLDGVILIAFILALPANEIVLPLILMGYTGAGTLSEAESMESLRQILIGAGWDAKRTLCVLLFCLMHWPCSTTLLTIKKESGSWGWTVLAAVLPTLFGLTACLLVNLIL